MLTPYQSKWTVKVRVNKCGEVRKFTNAKGEGLIFTFDIQDEARTPLPPSPPRRTSV